MSVDDNSGLLFLGRRKGAVPICVQEKQDFSKSFVPIMIPKHFRRNPVTLAEERSESAFGMIHVIYLDEASNEPNHDDFFITIGCAGSFEGERIPFLVHTSAGHGTVTCMDCMFVWQQRRLATRGPQCDEVQGRPD